MRLLSFHSACFSTTGWDEGPNSIDTAWQWTRSSDTERFPVRCVTYIRYVLLLSLFRVRGSYHSCPWGARLLVGCCPLLQQSWIEQVNSRKGRVAADPDWPFASIWRERRASTSSTSWHRDNIKYPALVDCYILGMSSECMTEWIVFETVKKCQ